MLNDFIGGGQIFLHKLRMFAQVAGRSMSIALLISGICGAWYAYPMLQTADTKAALTYQRAVLAVGFSDSLKPIRKIFRPQSSGIVTLDAYTKHGLFLKDMNARRIIDSELFAKPYTMVQTVLMSAALISSLTFCFALILVFAIWSRYGAGAKAKKHIKGHTIKTSKEVLLYLKRNKKASDISFGGMPLVKDSETKHIMITGSTGSGKTNCLHTILPQVRAKKQRAIIVDTEGDMVARYYRPGIDIIINPFDLRTANWNIWDEIDSPRAVKRLASSFFPDSPPDAHDYDAKWTSWGKMLFTGIIEWLHRLSNPSIELLYFMIHREPIDSLKSKLKTTSSSTILDSNSDNNSAPHNIRINTVLPTEWLEFISDDKENSFSFRNWFNDFDSNKSDGWVFIACDGADAKILLPFFSILMDVAINTLIGLGIKRDRRVWFVMDELAKLKYLPTLQENITLLRKYGGCVVAATQSFNQILATYGRTTGSVMLAQFNTNVIFRSKLDEAKLIAKQIGETEYLNYQKNISFGANDFRDGVSYTEQERKKELVTAMDIESLQDHEAYVLLPEAEVAVAKVQLEIAKEPKLLQTSFKNNTELGKMLIARQETWAERLRAIESDVLLTRPTSKGQKKPGRKHGSVSIPLAPDTNTVTEVKTEQASSSAPMEAGLTILKESRPIEAVEQEEENGKAKEEKTKVAAEGILQDSGSIEAKCNELMNSLNIGDMPDVS